jgi:hypothetical protein
MAGLLYDPDILFHVTPTGGSLEHDTLSFKKFEKAGDVGNGLRPYLDL